MIKNFTFLRNFQLERKREKERRKKKDKKRGRRSQILILDICKYTYLIQIYANIFKYILINIFKAKLIFLTIFQIL